MKNIDMYYKTSEVVCLNCLQRWISVRPESTRLIDLECPKCGEQGFVIETGEKVYDELQSDNLEEEIIKH